FAVQVFAFDPDEPVLLLPEINENLDILRQPDTVIADRRARRSIGHTSTGTETELARHKIRVVGTFGLGPNFFSDGNVVMSDRNFFTLFGSGSSNPADLPDIEAGIVKVLPEADVADVQKALRAEMPTSVAVLTKSELIEKEARFQ